MLGKAMKRSLVEAVIRDKLGDKAIRCWRILEGQVVKDGPVRDGEFDESNHVESNVEMNRKGQGNDWAMLGKAMKRSLVEAVIRDKLGDKAIRCWRILALLHQQRLLSRDPPPVQTGQDFTSREDVVPCARSP
jgi:hypothetical protein